MVELNGILIAFLTLYILQLVFSILLEKLNCAHLKRCGDQTARRFEGFIDAQSLAKINAYTQENSRLGVIQKTAGELILLGLLLGGIFPLIDRLVMRWELNVLWVGFLFFAVIGLLFYILGLPFDYYHTFVIEERYGFNRSNRRLWLTDHLKSGLLSISLLAVILIPILWVIRIFPKTWWIWGVMIVSALQILMMVLYPIVIAPLFNRFESLKDPDLAERVKALLQRAGFRLKGISQMDAGRRSRHTNAYFTGIGRSKRVVLFDTLIQRHPHEEILAVLAHELGHFKRWHIIKQLLFFEGLLLVIFYLTSRLMDWPILYTTFGFDAPSGYVGLFIIGIFWHKAGFFLRPCYLAISRRFEREADGFAVRLLSDTKPMATALKRMASDNLANLAPHPLYVWFHASHPPLLERIASLQKQDQA